MTDARAGAPARPGRAEERWLRGRSFADAGRPVRTAMLLGALAAVLVVPQAWLLARGIAPVVMDGAPLADAVPWLLPVLPLLVLRAILGHIADRSAIAAASAVKTAVRGDLLRHLGALGPAGAARLPSGDAAAVVIEGVDALDAYVSRFLAHLGVLAALPLVILAVVLPRDWISGLVLLGTAPVIPLFMVLLGHGAAELNRRQWRRLARLSAQLLDSLQRLTTLKALNATDREARRLAEASEDYRRSTMAVLRVAFLSSLALEFFATVGIAIWEMIERRSGETLVEVEQQIDAVTLDREHAHLLEVAEGTPALRVIRRYYVTGRRLVELSINLHPANRFSYNMRIKRDVGEAVPLMRKPRSGKK
ncbi:MAG: UTRA domain-containing protein [Hyphomicrobium sp.]|nr:UTRA domain-containing protein [Hyphomicrobium sp.]